MALKKISQLPAVADVLADDILPATQGDATHKVTVEQLAGFVRRTPVTSSSATSYPLALADMGSVIRIASASAVTVTVPTNASVALPVGSAVALRQVGTGQITIVAASGVVVNVPDGALAVTGRRHATVMLHKVGVNEWDLTGDLAAAS